MYRYTLLKKFLTKFFVIKKMALTVNERKYLIPREVVYETGEIFSAADGNDYVQ